MTELFGFYLLMVEGLHPDNPKKSNKRGLEGVGGYTCRSSSVPAVCSLREAFSGRF